MSRVNTNHNSLLRDTTMSRLRLAVFVLSPPSCRLCAVVSGVCVCVSCGFSNLTSPQNFEGALGPHDVLLRMRYSIRRPSSVSRSLTAISQLTALARQYGSQSQTVLSIEGSNSTCVVLPQQQYRTALDRQYRARVVLPQRANTIVFAPCG